MEKMRNIESRRQSVLLSLACLRESLDSMQTTPHTQVFYRLARNASIQCFEFSFDTLWKFLKEYIQVNHKVSIDVITPKSVLQQALLLKIINEEELRVLFDSVDARNITSHTYNEDLAAKVMQRMEEFYGVMKGIADRLDNADVK